MQKYLILLILTLFIFKPSIVASNATSSFSDSTDEQDFSKSQIRKDFLEKIELPYDKNSMTSFEEKLSFSEATNEYSDSTDQQFEILLEDVFNDSQPHGFNLDKIQEREIQLRLNGEANNDIATTIMLYRRNKAFIEAITEECSEFTKHAQSIKDNMKIKPKFVDRFFSPTKVKNMKNQAEKLESVQKEIEKITHKLFALKDAQEKMIKDIKKLTGFSDKNIAKIPAFL